MNVGCFLENRVPEKRVYDFYNGKVLRDFFQVFTSSFHFCFFSGRGELFRFSFYNFTEFRFQALLILLERLFYGRGICETRKYAEVRLFFDEVNCAQIIRIKHGYLKVFACFFESNNVVSAGKGFGNYTQSVGVDFFFF